MFYISLPIARHVIFCAVGALPFWNLPGDGEGQFMLVAFMYVANIGKKRIIATLLNILLGVLVVRRKRKTIRLT